MAFMTRTFTMASSGGASFQLNLEQEKSAPVLFLLYSGNGKPVPMYCTSEEVGDVVFSLTSASL